MGASETDKWEISSLSGLGIWNIDLEARKSSLVGIRSLEFALREIQLLHNPAEV